MPRIFISYRRDESTGYAGRIHERLAALYGADSVFMDVDDIQPGTDFVDAIDHHISSCDALLVLIGSRWLTAQDSAGRRRIEDPADFVRIEIAQSLARSKKIIPVLLDGASMPAAQSLPAAIQGLSRHQAIKLSEDRWDYDFDKLAEAVEGGQRRRKLRKKVVFALSAIALLAVIGALWLFREPAPELSGRWTAEVPYEFGPPRREAFTFSVSRKNIRGTASFLGVDRAIEEGAVDGAMLSFLTRTSEAVGNDSRETTHRYDGQLNGGEIRFVMQTTGGFSSHPPISFTAMRSADAP